MKDFEFKPEQIKKMNLFEKLLWAGKEAHGVEKSLSVSTGMSGGYKATGDVDVLKKVKEVESKYRVLTIVKDMTIVKSETKTIKNSRGERVVEIRDVELKTLIINVDNPEEQLVVTSLGTGEDGGDKMFGKASTYARKYALLNIFKLVTGDDPDQWASTEAVKTQGVKATFSEIKQELDKTVNNKKVSLDEELENKLTQYFETAGSTFQEAKEKAKIKASTYKLKEEKETALVKINQMLSKGAK